MIRKKTQTRLHSLNSGNDLAQQPSAIPGLKNNLAFLVAHELRTPLSIIRISANHIMKYRNRMRAAAIENKIKLILGQIDLMVTMLDDLLVFGETEASKIETTRRKIDICAFLDALRTEIEKVFQGSHTIHYKADLRQREVVTDDDLLRNIFINLLGNAIKFSPARTDVWVHVWGDQDNLYISVRDEGLGIREEEISKIFEPFQRGSNTKGIHGSGLGLCIVKKAVQALKATISVSSCPGKGSTFKVTLPIH